MSQFFLDSMDLASVALKNASYTQHKRSKLSVSTFLLYSNVVTRQNLSLQYLLQMPTRRPS
jgi:hypothetical protein